ncbi:WXG100 family type VII secretion target [Amycolatopsis regifaucium]|uniref:WXG100 family type VII secretion target n=1 Tax=Amycolatopsis regifaucium TaxID=546365 RepID=A0A154MVM2_9PSEU|nr:WXG100 family type VII secretion target [Amycolatopsis regifaucium]KZB87993.1 hypothetical protein AVL48_18565 [Amycolatopsis regifaucium]OKA04501.1 hypothetical protein ATP06_0231945 [Amycolatopsis regifaucium]SFH50770.1 Uncharacterized conserved protein YukE [Amycolatopsis regifaucium]
MTASEPVPIVDPEIEVLTFEQLVQLVNEVSPDSYYERAQAFDTATARLEQIQDDLARGTRELWDAWRGEGAEAFGDDVRNVNALGNTAIQAMASPGYGATLRRAGDALALAQQRIRDLQAQKREGDLPAARQVVHDLGVAYQEIGTAITPFPGAETDVPVNGQGPAANASAPAGVTPAMGATQPSAEGQLGRHGGGTGTPGGAGIVPAAALLPMGVPMAEGRPGRQGDVWAGLLEDTTQGTTASVSPAVVGKETPAARPASSGETVDGQGNGAYFAVLGRTQGVQAGLRNTESKKDKRKDSCRDESATAEQDEAPLKPEMPNADLTSPGASARAETTFDADLPERTAEPAPSVATVSATDASSTAPASHEPVHAKGPASELPPPPATTPVSETASSPSGTAAPAEVLKAPPLPHGSGAGLPNNATPASLGVPMQPAVTPVAGETSLPSALPASPAFRPAGGFDASSTPGLPPVVPGGTGSPRVPGEAMHGTGGGFMSPMLGGGAVGGGQDTENERQPMGLLGVDPKVWDASGNAPQVLGRSAAAPPPRALDLDDAKKKAMEMVDSVLGRPDRKDDDRIAE